MNLIKDQLKKEETEEKKKSGMREEFIVAKNTEKQMSPRKEKTKAEKKQYEDVKNVSDPVEVNNANLEKENFKIPTNENETEDSSVDSNELNEQSKKERKDIKPQNLRKEKPRINKNKQDES